MSDKAGFGMEVSQIKMQSPKTAQKLVRLLCSAARKLQFKNAGSYKIMEQLEFANAQLNVNPSHPFLGQN